MPLSTSTPNENVWRRTVVEDVHQLIGWWLSAIQIASCTPGGYGWEQARQHGDQERQHCKRSRSVLRRRFLPAPEWNRLKSGRLLVLCSSEGLQVGRLSRRAGTGTMQRGLPETKGPPTDMAFEEIPMWARKPAKTASAKHASPTKPKTLGGSKSSGDLNRFNLPAHWKTKEQKNVEEMRVHRRLPSKSKTRPFPRVSRAFWSRYRPRAPRPAPRAPLRSAPHALRLHCALPSPHAPLSPPSSFLPSILRPHSRHLLLVCLRPSHRPAVLLSF